MENTIVKGYKVTDKNMQCREFQFELGVEFVHEGPIKICGSGFHFCQQANNCFNYYDFDSNNRVFEVEATGIVEHGDDKSVTTHIKLIRELSWMEVLVLCNTGKDNTGRGNSGDRNSGDRNSGDRNSGYWNSGDRNSGDRNSGDSNSGDRNSGDRNSGNWNSGNWNSGNWNSGYRNSGDSNSGYRNSGAFCIDPNPKLILFDQPTNILVKDWEQSEAVRIMTNLDPTIWVPMSIMTDEEKAKHPKYETTEGYLKTITLKEAWRNLWPNLADDKKKLFTDLPNFCPDKFLEITGVDVRNEDFFTPKETE